MSELASFDPHISFIQEWDPRQAPLLAPECVQDVVNPVKGVALVSHSDLYQLVRMNADTFQSRGVVRARIEGPVSFQAIGIWAQAPGYATHVIETVSKLSSWIQQSPTVVMGDFNSGTDMATARPLTRSHSQLIEAMSEAGLTSAYHAFHSVEHACEIHATYFHQFKTCKPWHIDFVFVPESWRKHLKQVVVVDGMDWGARSDHRPVFVEVAAEELR